MSRRTNHPLAPRPSPLTARGFTFIEVLFAIIILGIGSIMIAGMLPVAIKQTSDTRNAITGKAACEAGYAYLQAIANSANLIATNIDTNAGPGGVSLYGAGPSPQTAPPSVIAMLETEPYTPPPSTLTAPFLVGKMVPLTFGTIDAGDVTGPFNAFQSTVGSRVLTADPRTQWLAFYGRSVGSSTATLVVLALHLQNTETTATYTQATLTNADNGPFLLNAQLTNGGAIDPDRITLSTPAGGGNGLLAADTGAFVIVANNLTPSATNDPLRGSRNNGRVFRLGTRRPDLDVSGGQTYELQPGYDLPPLSYGPDNQPNTADDVVDNSMNSTGNGATQVWVVGKGLLNPAAAYNASSNPYAGLVQDVGVLTTQVQLSN